MDLNILISKLQNENNELRKKNGYSQEELAAKLGLSRQAVSKWERAEASPDTDNLVELAKLYGSDRDAYNLALQLMHSVEGSAYIAG